MIHPTSPSPSDCPRANRRAAQREAQRRHAAEAAAQIDAMPVAHPHAAGIDVGDRTHWVGVEKTPDGSDPIREFPAHPPGLRQLVAWLQFRGVTTVALEATGAYGQVLFLTLLESGRHVITTSAQFTRQIQGRPKTDKRDCQWIQRWHRHGLLPSIFQPDEATQTLRDSVRQRANLVRRSSHHLQRMQKALELMNLKLTPVLEAVTGQTGRKIIRAIVDGVRDPRRLALLRDKRCKHSVAEIATALDGRYRDEHRLELRCGLTRWDHYREVIALVEESIAVPLRKMSKQTLLPPLPPKPRVRGKRPHDPKFDVRQALYLVVGVDRTAIEGIDEMHALTLIRAWGCDFTKWPRGKHFTRWLGLCPNFQKTGGKVQSSKTRRGKGRAAPTFRLAAWSLMRSKSYLGAYRRRQRSRLGAPKAITATAHKLA